MLMNDAFTGSAPWKKAILGMGIRCRVSAMKGLGQYAICVTIGHVLAGSTGTCRRQSGSSSSLYGGFTDNPSFEFLLLGAMLL